MLVSDEIKNDIKANLSACKYWIIGTEVAPTTGTQHWQGFLYTHNPIRLSTVKTMLVWTVSKAHIEFCKGTPQQNIEYCKKEGSFEEHGDPPMPQSEKGDKGSESQKIKWQCINNAAMQGDFDWISVNHPREFLVHYQNLKRIKQDGLKVKDSLPNDLVNEWLWGESGVGKSSKARRENLNLYVKDAATQWWDMYEGEDVVLIEDVSPFNRSHTDYLKIWSDRYPFKAQYKGGYMQIRPKKIVVTSQYTIDEIWEDQKTRDAMHRRFKEIKVDEDLEAKIRAEEATFRNEVEE